jgi:hypothetical protein
MFFNILQEFYQVRFLRFIVCGLCQELNDQFKFSPIFGQVDQSFERDCMCVCNQFIVAPGLEPKS